MAIITQADIEGRISEAELIRLTDDGATGAVDATVLAAVIAGGEGEVLALIQQQWVVPLQLTDANTAAMVEAMLLDVIVYRLYARRMPIPEDAIAAYETAKALAEKIGSGTIGLVGEIEIDEAPAAGGAIIVDAETQVISREDMKGL